jgi:NAD(P)-dependent dehydrogenase (short-subunit alcohol dehydrogenase family)
MGKLDGRVAIVTGASRGFGEATAYLWANEGARVVIADVLVQDGERVIKRIEDGGGDAIFVKADVTKESDAENMVKTAVDAYGKLDILFNNAGILGPGRRITEISEDDIDRLLAINVKGVMLGTKHAIPAMIKSGGGVILNTGSDSAFHGNRGIPIYCATKGAVISFTRAIAMDHVKDGIRCNTVSPCIGKTPMHAQFIEEDPDRWNDLVSLIPMGRACDVEDIAKAALFLVSDDSSFITGENLMVDGGTLVRGS